MAAPRSPLADWLIRACEARELSWAEASRRAGLYQGAISAMVGGVRPGLEACKSLAHYFGAPVEDVLRLAGHLPPDDAGPAWPPELISLVSEVERLPAPLQRAAIRAWRAVLEGIEAGRKSA